MQGRSNNMRNQGGTGIKSHKTLSSQNKQTKTSQIMEVFLIMKTKGSRRVQAKTNSIETKTDKVVLTAALHKVAAGIKMVFNLSQ